MSDQVTPKQKSFYEDWGYTVLRGVLSQEQVKRVNHSFHQVWIDLLRSGEIVQDAGNPVESLFPRLRDNHLTRSDIAELLLSDAIFDIASTLLAEEALAISSSYYFKAPGTRGLPMHQDNYSVGAAPGTTCSIWVSLGHSNEANGGVYVVPGSHKLGLLKPELAESSLSEYGEKLELPQGYEKLQLELFPGDAVAFHGNLVHGSGENREKSRFRHAHVTHFTGVSARSVNINHNTLMNRQGERVRRRLNTAPKLKNDTLKGTEWSGIGGSPPWK
ncbi:phytanoyl-CoA dioxygenase family protein [Paenibacillus sp. FSL K6-1230]|uniref:phytanoyl-CoA dioxygenase family protein n=1 Tax=Paenibacillus sp. FSL K6-1230 TaxID=2921603 RepID=UPI0030F9A6F1